MELTPRLARRFDRVNSRYVKIGAFAVLLFYAVVMMWPYLAATLVRGSAVTAWTNIATSPIRGRAPAKLPFPGEHVGADGVVMMITNDLLDPGRVRVAEADLAHARARIAALRTYLSGVQEIDHDRLALMKLHADNYRAELNAEISILTARVELLKAKVAAAVLVADRGRTVADSGYRSKDYRDEAQIRLAEAEVALAVERMALERAQRRRAAADQGVYIGLDGASLNWAYNDRQEAKTEIKRAHLQLEEAVSGEQQAERALDAAREAFKLQHSAPVTAPPGATIRSISVGGAAAVEPGGPIGIWIDCNELYVDAPVSDAALALIPIGSKAEMIIEGESHWRKARVTNVRGAAQTIGASDLAAVAKGRHRGDGQVLLRLDASAKDFAACPVGEAAYVHFPTAGLFAVLLARLGLR